MLYVSEQKKNQESNFFNNILYSKSNCIFASIIYDSYSSLLRKSYNVLFIKVLRLANNKKRRQGNLLILVKLLNFFIDAKKKRCQNGLIACFANILCVRTGILLLLKYRDATRNSRQLLTFRLQPCITG